MGNRLRNQIGTTEFVNLLSAAHSPYGWLGGLDGARCLLSTIDNAFGQKIGPLQLGQSMKLLPITARVLTAEGPLKCSFDDAREAFGGDARTQFIGLTFCALAHHTEGSTAVDLFRKCLLPIFCEGSDDVANALHSQLNDESYIQQIFNEGAARGLTNVFASATAALKVPEGGREW